MKTWKTQHKTASNASRQPMFRPVRASNRTAAPQPFFSAAPRFILQPLTVNPPIIQRQETEEAKPEEKDPVVEGLKTTGEKLLEYPKFKAWFEPKLDFLKQRLWEEQPSNEKAAIITFGSVNLALAGLVFALNPEIRELLSDVNIGKPLGLIPYSPIEGFKYKLPEPGKSAYGFSGEFTFNSYLELLRNRYPQVPLTGATFGLDTGYTPGQGVSLTGGKFGLEFLGGGLKVEGKTFTELSPYPITELRSHPMFLRHGTGSFQPSATLMQSYPELPSLKTGPGFQVMISADLYKLFPKLAKLF